MHSRIFQITKEQAEQENYLNKNTLGQGDAASIDYCAEIDSKDREESITYFVDNILPKGMFTQLGANILRYNGGMEQCKKESVAKIKEKTATLTADNYFRFDELYTLKKAVEDTHDPAYLFYTDKEGLQSWADQSYDFMCMVNELEEGALLYIGGVIDYHF